MAKRPHICHAQQTTSQCWWALPRIGAVAMVVCIPKFGVTQTVSKVLSQGRVLFFSGIALSPPPKTEQNKTKKTVVFLLASL